jgi:hypothetical protein
MTKSTKQVAPGLALGAGLGAVIASIAGGMWLALGIAISVVLGELMSKKDKGKLKTRSRQEKEYDHGITGASFHLNSSQPQRSGRQS